jgi:hypothetical protein
MHCMIVPQLLDIWFDYSLVLLWIKLLCTFFYKIYLGYVFIYHALELELLNPTVSAYLTFQDYKTD